MPRRRSSRFAIGCFGAVAAVDLVAELLLPLEQPIDIDRADPLVMMIAGVNGAGKTTSIGKLARHLQRERKTVLLAAGDTFRAAAREQLAEDLRRVLGDVRAAVEDWPLMQAAARACADRCGAGAEDVRELLEWLAAEIGGHGADAFLATQGDVRDTQWDMFCALVGATLSVLLLSRPHDRQLRALEAAQRVV